MQLTLVRFAESYNDIPEYFLLDDKKFDDWVVGEPQKGYHIFQIMGCFDIQALLVRDGIETRDLLDFLPGAVDKPEQSGTMGV